MCVCDLVPATTGRRTEGPGGDVPRARLTHPGLAEGLTREFMDRAGRVLSRRSWRILDSAAGLPRTREARLVGKRQRLQMELLLASGKGGLR